MVIPRLTMAIRSLTVASRRCVGRASASGGARRRRRAPVVSRRASATRTASLPEHAHVIDIAPRRRANGKRGGDRGREGARGRAFDKEMEDKDLAAVGRFARAASSFLLGGGG